jgi:PAS domain S-box-containing protein
MLHILSRMPLLKILNGELAGKQFRLSDRDVVIGRHPDCDIVISDETISRRHARIVNRGGGYYLEDQGSRNGTTRNGYRVDAPVRLLHGDRFQLFSADFEFLDDVGDHVPDRTSAGTRAPEPVVRERERVPEIFETVHEIDVADPGTLAGQVSTDGRLQAVLQITRYLRSSREPNQILSQIVECTTQIFPQYSRAYLLKFNEQSGRLDPVVIRQPDDETGGPLTLPPISKALAKQVLNNGKALFRVGISEDGDEESSVLDDDAWSFMCAPLVGPSRQRVGILYIETTDSGGRFTHDDLEVFACVAILAGQALEQATWFGARYHAVFNTAADGIITIDSDRLIESVNPAVTTMFGYAPRELIGRDASMLLAGQDQELPPDDHARKSRSEFPFERNDREMQARRRDGTEFPIHLSIGEFELGGRRHFTWIIHDVSERHRAEAELRKWNETLEQQVRERTESISLMQDVAVIANAAESVEQAFQFVLDRICRFKGWEVGHVFMRSDKDPQLFVDTGIWAVERPARFRRLMDATASTRLELGQGMVGRVATSGMPAWLPRINEDSEFTRSADAVACGLHTAAASAVMVGTEVLAVIEFFSTVPSPPDEAFLGVLKQVGTQLGRVIERDRFQRQMVDAVWDQHRRLGQDLHDSLGQALTGIGMLADGLSHRLKADGFADADKIAELEDMIQEAKTEVRRLAKGLYPVDVDAHGLLSALDDLASITEQRWKIPCVFKGDAALRITDNQVATHLFRIAQEAVHNAVKHGQPGKIVISLGRRKGRLALAISDNGKGIGNRPSNSPPGLGTRIMQYRANAMRADLVVERRDRGGTVVRCTLRENAT